VAVGSYDSVDRPEGGAAIVQTALDEFGRLDAVISNAGIFQTVPFDELTIDDWHRMLQVHLDGAFNLSQAAYRAMKRSGYGRFVFITSSAGLFGQPNSAHYAAAKAGTLGLANVIAIEGAEHGIAANCVLPFGYSRMVFETVGDRDELEPDPGFLHAIEPELVVPIVVYLASRTCEFTHHNFSACAGRFARVFVGLSDGWVADPKSHPTADDIAEHIAEVAAAEPYMIPTSIFDEVFKVCTQLGIG
jgi:NAD(P)-dependent dehydrogenase (short-subunit alcohol dehydrogenase family)